MTMLYIVGTPIGNAQDISYRAAELLLSTNVICAEDTRSFARLRKSIEDFSGKKAVEDQKVIAYHDQNEFQQLPYVMKILEDGKDICLVSEAGMPIISDPGALLIKETIKKDVPMTVIPGPTAFTTSAVLSGFDASNLLFIGFLPKKDGEIKKIIDKLKVMSETIAPLSVTFYESPHRIQKTLHIIDELLPAAKLSIGRELSKEFEEVARGYAKDLKEREYKGEVTVVMLIKS